jgi:hypothetical protein
VHFLISSFDATCFTLLVLAEVRNAWSYTSTPQYIFMAWCLVKHNFTIILLLCIIIVVEEYKL